MTTDEITGDQIKAYRKSLGLTQAELAAHLGLAPITVSKWEQGGEHGRSVSMAGVVRRALRDLAREVAGEAIAGQILARHFGAYSKPRSKQAASEIMAAFDALDITAKPSLPESMVEPVID